MTDMFFASVLLLTAVALVLALLPQCDICTQGIRRLVKNLSDRLYKHA